MLNILLGFLRALKLPAKLLRGLLKKRKKRQKSKRDELEKKLRTHLWNFSPGRLKNRTWWVRDKRKKSVKSSKKWKKKANNLKG